MALIILLRPRIAVRSEGFFRSRLFARHCLETAGGQTAGDEAPVANEPGGVLPRGPDDPLRPGQGDRPGAGRGAGLGGRALRRHRCGDCRTSTGQAGEEPGATIRTVMPGYVRTLGIPVTKGRVFTPADNTLDSPYRFVINLAFRESTCPARNRSRSGSASRWIARIPSAK